MGHFFPAPFVFSLLGLRFSRFSSHAFSVRLFWSRRFCFADPHKHPHKHANAGPPGMIYATRYALSVIGEGTDRHQTPIPNRGDGAGRGGRPEDLSPGLRTAEDPRQVLRDPRDARRRCRLIILPLRSLSVVPGVRSAIPCRCHVVPTIRSVVHGSRASPWALRA